MSQRSLILAALRRGDSLTALECLARFGCHSPSSAIRMLRRDGWKIPPPTFYNEHGHRFGVWKMEEAR